MAEKLPTDIEQLILVVQTMRRDHVKLCQMTVRNNIDDVDFQELHKIERSMCINVQVLTSQLEKLRQRQ